MTKQILKSFLFFLTCNLLLTQASFGQDRVDIENEIRKLDRKIEVVRELANSFDNARARELVHRAQVLRNQAVHEAENKNFASAIAKIKMATDLLEQAVKLTLAGPVRRLRSRLEELLRRAENEVLGGRSKEAERILREAKVNRDAAERALTALQVNRAVEHFRVAITLAERAIDVLHHSGNWDRDRILEEKRKFETLRNRASELVRNSNNNQAKRIFQQALKVARKAEEAFRNGNFKLTKKLYNQTVLLLLRAMDLASVDAPVNLNQAEVALFNLKQLIEESAHPIVNSGRPRAKMLYERAKRFAKEAEIANQNGRRNEALWKIELAENMVQRARRLALGGQNRQFSGKISKEIENTKKEILQVRQNITLDSPKDAEMLIRMSETLINKADQAAKTGSNRVALEAVLAAQKFLAKAEIINKDQESAQISNQKLAIRFGQLDAALSEAESVVNSAGKAWNRQLLKSAKEIREISHQSYQKGNLSAANEGIQVSFELIRKSLKNLPKN